MAEIKSLTLQDVAQAKRLSDAEGWNQTAIDWKLLITSPGSICLAFWIGDKLVATATALTYSKDLAWIGMVLVDVEHRGKGISRLLLTALLAELKSFRTVKLDATPAGQPVYQKLGFKTESMVYRMISESASMEKIQLPGKASEEKMNSTDFSEIVDYDRQVMGINRKFLMEYLFRFYPHLSFMLRRQNKIAGFAMGREGARFNQSGPLVAGTVEDAEELMTRAIFANAGKKMIADVPEDKADFILWLKNAGFTIHRSFIRMHLFDGSFFRIPPKCFLIGGPEFG